jgi:chromosome segregation ATPase
MTEEPENLVLQLLRGIRDDVAKVDRRVDELRNELVGEINSLRADVASDLVTMQAAMQKETREQITGLRRAVVEYHSSVVGHGVLISEHEERIRRLEQVLNLPPLKTG